MKTLRTKLLLLISTALLLGCTNLQAQNWSYTSPDIIYTVPDNVGIGTSTPDEKLDVHGNVRINNNVLYLRGVGNNDHGLAYNGLNSVSTVDGPVIFGWKGGALGSTNSTPGQRIAFLWDEYG